MKLFILLLLFPISSIHHKVVNNPDLIIGKWMNADDNNLEVEIYKLGNEYKAKLIWFDDSDDKSSPMDMRLDLKNPDKSLQHRKLLGIEVMHGLIYNAEDDEWQDGKIYDSSSGKEWDAKAWINDEGYLKVRGYWHFSIFGQTMRFKKV